MNHAASCRAALEAAVPWIKANPDKMVMFIESGSVAARLGGLGMAYHYTLTIVLQDFAHHIDTIMVPLLQWIRGNQPALLQNPDDAKKAISFEAEILDSDTCDLRLQIKLFEGVKVSIVGGEATVEHLPEPEFVDPADYPVIERVRIIHDGETVDDSAAD